MIETSGFWQGRRVLVTGGAGFLGRFVVEKLRDRGCREIFVCRQRDYDLRSPEAIQRVLRDSDAHVVIHLAGRVGGIGANRSSPAEFFYDNLMMGIQLLHAAWQRGVEKFVAVGTVCGYPKYTPVPFREEDFWNGYPEETNAPYGLAKKMLLVQSQTYRQQYGFNSIYLIPVNLYGPGDNFDLETSHVIPALIRKCIEAKEQGADHVVVWGSGEATREFLYVEDAAEGIVSATECFNGEEPINLGCGREISINELVKHIAHLTGFSGDVVWDSSKPDGQRSRRLNTERAKKLFEFQAETSFEKGLQRTVEWYLSHRYAANAISS